MARFTDDFLIELRARTDIEDLISSYVSIQRRGSNLVGLCPFHNEKTPSFTVFPETESFYCFGCGAGGEAITFIRRIENLDFADAVKFLADRAGMKLPENNDDAYDRLRQRVLSASKQAAKFFHQELMKEENRHALEYFLGRGLTPATIKHFGLGYAPNSWDSLYKYMRSQGFNEVELVAANLIVKGKNGKHYDMFRNRPMFPIIDVRGNVVAFGGRALGDAQPKYINSSDTPVFKKNRELFALNFAKKHCKDRLILAEGYMDVIALHQAGFENAVATLGTALTENQAKIMSRYTNEVIISYDSDAAGKKALERAIGIFEKIGTPVRVLEIKGGKDPDEFIRTFGRDKFKALLEGAENDTEYRILKAREGLDLETSAGKVEFLSRIAQILSSLSTAVEREVYASKIANELKIDKGAILRDAERAYSQRMKNAKVKTEKELISSAKRDKINPDRYKAPKGAAAEEAIIALLLRNPDFYSHISQNLSSDDFITAFNKKVFDFIMNRLAENRSIELTVFSEEFTPQEIDRIVSLEIRGKTRANSIDELNLCIGIVKEEKQRTENADVSKMSNDEWQEYINNLLKNKK